MPPNDHSSGSADSKRASSAAVLARRLAIPLFTVVGAAFGAWALMYTGATNPMLVGDSGPLGRIGLPIAEFFFQAASVVVIGAIILMMLILPRSKPQRRRGAGARRAEKKAKQLAAKKAAAGKASATGKATAAATLTVEATAASASGADAFKTDRKADRDVELDPSWAAALLTAQIGSIFLVLSSVATLILRYVNTAGTAATNATQAEFSAQLGAYITQIDSGRLWSLVVVTAIVMSMILFATRSFAGIGWTALLTVLILLPQAVMGHAAEAKGHIEAVNSLGLHLVAVMAWVGGLVVLALISPTLTGRQDLGEIIKRYSTIALFSIVIMAYSGFVNATLRVKGLDDWLTPYGQLVIIKVVFTVILGLIGFWHRERIIGRLGSSMRAAAEFWRLVLAEIAIFGAVVAIGIVLASSQPPVPQELRSQPTPSEILSGELLPPEPLWYNYFLQWRFDPLWVVIGVGASVLYIMGYRELKKRGGQWPLWRTISWVGGMAMLIYVTCGGPMVYGRVLFSGHMIQHMLIVMLVPIPMVVGAPITLLMRAIHPRQDGSRGVREWILILVHSKYMRFWAHPIVASINFSGSLIVFYYSGIMWYALKYHLGHELMIIHFLAAGYMFAQAMIGVDPGVKRFPHAVRFVVLLVTMTFHAFFGISIMTTEVLIEPEWYGNMGQTWISALDDQQLGGGIAWGIGEFPTLILAFTAAVQWSKASDREAKRKDRAEARSGDAELRAYNEYLASLGGKR
ncbi:cytochrome c oxidase assembly protein [Brevibacterium ravenspurgense]|uniref:cytochrome c oxidase assembly protein n=1 Tax=Brevibacterium ravenspurgense TaxID=479117 RepID=UPI001E56CAE4|nr:cytochrome c oxidase assembly protein [Brevibacterium ravenspurgense]